MKTNLLSLTNVMKAFATGLFMSTTFLTQAQSGPGGGSGSGGSQSIPELVFKSPKLESGTALADNAVYRFKDIANNVDALVKIAGRSSPLVQISSIDLDNTGYDNAFQPKIIYNGGNAGSYKNWYVDFEISFVNKGAGNAVAVSTFNVTALDVDGDGSKLNEYVSFYGAQSYILERNTQITVQNLLQLILGLLTPGKEFDGPTTNYTDIDVTATKVMTTLTYNNKNSFRMRAGAETSNGSSSVADRMYSFWFKGFNFNTPVQTTLPVKLISFTAALNANKAVDVKWTTAEEKNVSHFEIEKSTDGKNFTSIGLVFAYGNTSEKVNYSFTDKNISQSGVMYYRLRSVDIDKKSQLSEVKLIRIASKNEQTISILTYPNPVTSELRVTIPANWQGEKVSYEVLSNSGQVIIRNEASASGQTENINVSKLSTGYYVVRVSCKGETAQQKIIKQ
jgi:Secretion system C-terminal sorting domain